LTQEWLKAKQGKVSPSYWSKVDTTVRANTKHLAPLPVACITAPLILDELRRVESRGAIDLAKRLKQYIGQIFDYAIATGRFVGANPCAPINQDVLQAHKPDQYPTLASRADVGAFLRRLAEYPGRPENRIAIELQLLTATRPGELRAATWDEFDLTARLWRIPAERMKARREHLVPLTQRALNLLAELRPHSGHLGFLFPGMRP
jgi:integrase